MVYNHNDVKDSVYDGKTEIDRFLVHIVQEYFENPALNLSLTDMLILFNSFSESSLLQTTHISTFHQPQHYRA